MVDMKAERNALIEAGNLLNNMAADGLTPLPVWARLIAEGYLEQVVHDEYAPSSKGRLAMSLAVGR